MFYKASGSGRDTYIKTNNGGFTVEPEVASFP
jgi:hypothetical protein